MTVLKKSEDNNFDVGNHILYPQTLLICVRVKSRTGFGETVHWEKRYGPYVYFKGLYKYKKTYLHVHNSS